MSCGTILLFVVASVVLIYGGWLTSEYMDDQRAIRLRANVRVAPPTLFARLVGVGGLDPREPPPPAPLAFHLAVDADGVSRCYRACSGGGDSMLRVSYHGMVLAWGKVPWYCIDGERMGRSVDGVVAVVAKSEGSAGLPDDVRGLLVSERRIMGKVEFDVEGEVDGLGYLLCKVFLFDGEPTREKAMCQVQ